MRKVKTFSLFLFLFLNVLILSSFVNAESNNISEGEIWIISGNQLIKQKSDLILQDNFIIFTTYKKIHVEYYKGNETYFNKTVYGGQIKQLSLVDNAHLVIKHNNSIVLNSVTHKSTVTNLIRYGIDIPFSDLIIPILMAFVSGLLINIAYYYNLEKRVI